MPIKKNKISYTLNLEDEFNKNEIKPSKRKQLSELIGAELINEIVTYLDRGITPVSKGEYKRSLSKKYKEIKKKKTGVTFADLQLESDMLSNLSIKATKTGVEIQITDNTQKKKAYNHNVGDTLPKRQFLPNDENNEQFKATIIKRVKDNIRNASESDE